MIFFFFLLLTYKVNTRVLIWQTTNVSEVMYKHG